MACYINRQQRKANGNIIIIALNILFIYVCMRHLNASKNRVIQVFTISKQHEDGQIHSSFPARIFLDGDAIAGGGEHLAAPDGDQLTALVSARHVVQHCSVIDEGVQFAAEQNKREMGKRVRRKQMHVWIVVTLSLLPVTYTSIKGEG